MIKFSRSEDYAVVLVNVLSSAYQKRLVPLSEIAKEYHLSLLFLRNIANQLKHAGVISAIEGKSGGYTLTKDPKKMSMGEILSLFTNESSFGCCEMHKIHGICQKAKTCLPALALRRINHDFISKISKLSISEFQHYAE